MTDPMQIAVLREGLAVFLDQMAEAQRRIEIGEMIDRKQEPLAEWAAKVCNAILGIPTVAKAVGRVRRLSDQEVVKVAAVVAQFMRTNEHSLKAEAGRVMHQISLASLRRDAEEAMARASAPQAFVDAQHVIRRRRP